jgi:CCR4-NOT transcription complex subunit 4
MQKKQRAQKAKERELSTVAPVEPEPEPQIAPIQGRKKKQKKEKAVGGAAGGSTPVVSRPSSPRAMPESTNQGDVPPAEVAQPSTQTTDNHTPAETELEKKAMDLKAKGKPNVQSPTTRGPVSAATTEVEDEPAARPSLVPSSVFQHLISEGIIEDPSNLSFLKPPHVGSRYQDPQTELANAIPKLTITHEDRATLLSGRPIHKNIDGPNRMMLTPNGDCVRNLTPEEEERYLELQSRIARESGPTAFFSAKHHASSGFSLIGGRAVPNGPPTFFPQSSSAAPILDPVSKIQRDEALSYINQYVLPSLSTNSQLESALNANYLGNEIIRPSESSAWSPWNNDHMPQRSENTDGAYGAAVAQNRDGILATGLEGITAHFAVGRDIDRGQPLGNVTMLSVSEAEAAMQAAKKETEGLEKRLNALLKKNRRLLLGSGN